MDRKGRIYYGEGKMVVPLGVKVLLHHSGLQFLLAHLDDNVRVAAGDVAYSEVESSSDMDLKKTMDVLH